MTSIKNSTFKHCTSLTSITIPNSVTSIKGYSFYKCTALTTITIPNSVTIIEDDTFGGSGLTSITIPNSVTTIGLAAFRDCSNLTTVIIGNGVTNVEHYAFRGCYGLRDVYCYVETVPETDNEAFNRSSIGECILHVPAVSVDNYKASYIWGAFKEVVPLTDSDSKPTGIDDVRCKISDIRGTYYDLNGVRQSEAKRGINILNGKKVVVK